MTTRKDRLSEQRLGQANRDIVRYRATMRELPQQSEVDDLVREARRLLRIITGMRNALYREHAHDDNILDIENAMAASYREIRLYQNALLRRLDRPILTTYPTWVDRCFR